MLNELVAQVAQKTGISEDQARTATETVIGFLKQRLPAPAASALDGVIGSGGDMLGQAQNMMGGLGGMFGGSKE